MNAFTTFFSLFFAPLLMALFASARPLDSAILLKKDVFVPRIIEPNASTVWTSGEIRNVTWDTSDAPAHITNSLGIVTLDFEGIASPVVLASGFNILDGSVEVTVPTVFTRNDYAITLFGDSGNFSDEFEIIGVEE